MQIFISWSGSTSKELAKALRKWLPGVIQAVKPYFSPDDVAKGTRWNTEISKELEGSSIGLICLTPENLEAPWIMFESGALAKKLNKSRVCPILFGIDPTDIKGPLVQFQASKFEKGEIKKVVKMINGELGESALSSSTLDSVFEMWWPKLKEEVDEILENTDETSTEQRTERDLLEEILSLTRSMQVTTRRPTISSNVVKDIVEPFLLLVEEAAETGTMHIHHNDLISMFPTLEFLVKTIRNKETSIELMHTLNKANSILEKLTVDSSDDSSESLSEDIPF